MATKHDEHCFLCLGPLDPKGVGVNEPYPCTACPAAVHRGCVVSQGQIRIPNGADDTYMQECVCQHVAYLVKDIEKHTHWQWKPREARQYWRFVLTLLVCTLLHPQAINNLFPAPALALNSLFFLTLGNCFDPEEEKRPKPFYAYAAVSGFFALLTADYTAQPILVNEVTTRFLIPHIVRSFELLYNELVFGISASVGASMTRAFDLFSFYFPSLAERAIFDYWMGYVGLLLANSLCIPPLLMALWSYVFEEKTRPVIKKM